MSLIQLLLHFCKNLITKFNQFQKNKLKKITSQKSIVDKVDLFIIGSQKFGTSTVFDNLTK